MGGPAVPQYLFDWSNVVVRTDELDVIGQVVHEATPLAAQKHV